MVQRVEYVRKKESHLVPVPAPELVILQVLARLRANGPMLLVRGHPVWLSDRRRAGG